MMNYPINRLRVGLFSAAICFSPICAEPVIVSAGKGSYAAEPPNANPALAAFLAGPDRLDPSLGDTAYPSNDIWSFGIWSNERERFAFGRPYLMPLAVTADAGGFKVFLSNSFNQPLGAQSLGAPLQISAMSADGAPVSFPAKSQRVLRIGDWSMTFRFRPDDRTHVDMTTVRGMPIVWLEPGSTLGLAVPVAGAKITGLDGQSAFVAGTANALIAVGERRFALYVGGKGGLKVEGDNLVVTPGAALAIAALLPGHDAASWRGAAMSVPRDTRVDWRYNRAAGTIDTVWSIKTDKLAPDAGPSLQGWLPHCWRNAMERDVKFIDASYQSPRGLIKLARGDSFRLSWRVTGLLPSMPTPPVDEKDAPFDPARFNEILAAHAKELTGTGPDGKSLLKYGKDTYFGGKDVLKYAQVAAAAQFHKSPSAPALVAASREVLTDWFTWTPGETSHYWARYEKIGAFVGFSSSFNSHEFRDTHFHCGYFTHSAAIQASADPAFAQDFGEFGKLIAKQYANWDRADKRFPFLRTFDLWAGHSFASAKGNAPGDSANQESSSEAMNAWAGVGLLGAVLNDEAMLAAGLMGYAIEGEATKEYWNNYYGWKAEQAKPGTGATTGNWPASFRNTIVGIVSQGGNRFGTFFSGAPYHIYGIQWLPMSPALQYVTYGDDRFGLHQYETMKKIQQANAKSATFDLETLEQGDFARWSNVFAGYLAIVDPVNTAARWEAMWKAGSPVTRSTNNTLSYYFIHAYRAVGVLDIEAWADTATASVYRKADGSRHLVAWNPGAGPLTVTARNASGVLGTVNVAPRALVRVPLKR